MEESHAKLRDKPCQEDWPSATGGYTCRGSSAVVRLGFSSSTSHFLSGEAAP